MRRREWRGLGRARLGGGLWGLVVEQLHGGRSREEMRRAYQLRPVYFRRDAFKSTADCLTAAYTQRLPLEVCQ